MTKSVNCPVKNCSYSGNFRGLTAHCVNSHPSENKTIRKRVMIDEYKDVVGECQTCPEFKEIENKIPFGRTPILNLFGSYKEFVNEVGIKYHRYSKDEILETIKNVSENKLNGERPSYFDIKEFCHFSPEIVQHHFGSLTDAHEILGFEPQHRNVQKGELLKEIERVESKVEGTPTIKNMREVGKYTPRLYQRRFGSWNNAVEKAGFEPNAYHGSGEDNPMFGVTGEDNANYNVTGEDHPQYIHGSPDNPHADVEYRRNREKLLEECGGVCQHPDCSKEKSEHGIGLDCHHIIPHKLLDDDVKHNIENLIILCREHHSEVEPPNRCKIPLSEIN